jgi:hypothetical protein
MPDPAPFSGAEAESTAEQIARWESVYGTKRRQLFRWLATGRAHGYACPLDHPVEMLRWWSPPRMLQRIPEKLLAAARHAAAAAPAPAGPQSPPASKPALPAPPAGDLFDAPSLEFPAQVEQMRGEQARIQRQLDDARRGRLVDGTLYVDQSAVESLLRQRLAISEPLRKAEGDLTAWLERRELLAPTAAVRGENARICGAIFAAVRRLWKTVRPALAGMTDAQADQLWEGEACKCFAALKEAKFTDFATVTAEPTP